MAANAERALSMIAADIRAAVEHDDSRLISLDVQYEGKNADTVDFVISVPTSRLDQSLSGRWEVGYYVDNDDTTEEEWLLRRVDDTPDDDLLADGAATLVGPGVAELNVAFYDGMEWADGWEDQAQFPRAVRIGIVVVDPQGNTSPRYFETVVSPSCR